MRILHSKKIIFISKPRCGSTSLRRLLDSISEPGDLKVDFAGQYAGLHPHMTAQSIINYLDSLGISHQEYKFFTVARAPLEMLWSYYNFFKPDNRCNYNYSDQYDGLNLMSFSHWLNFGKVNLVRNYNPFFEKFINPNDLSPLSLNAHVCDEKGNIIVDKVLKIENQEGIVSWLENASGTSGLNLLKSNSSKSSDMPHVNDEILSRLKKQLPLDFSIYE